MRNYQVEGEAAKRKTDTQSELTWQSKKKMMIMSMFKISGMIRVLHKKLKLFFQNSKNKF